MTAVLPVCASFRRIWSKYPISAEKPTVERICQNYEIDPVEGFPRLCLGQAERLAVRLPHPLPPKGENRAAAQTHHNIMKWRNL